MKKKVVSVAFGFSENCWFQDTFKDNKPTFLSLADANALLHKMALDGAKLGYDKTDFEVEWDDGYVYRGRYDLHPRISHLLLRRPEA